MRKAVFFLLLLLLASACKKSIEYETLASRWPVFAEVYALKDSTPDSALTLMQRVADTMDVDALGKQSAFLLSEYQVLRTEVLYKNYALRRGDTIAFEAFRFYDSVMPKTSVYGIPNDLRFQKARSYYYKAVVEEILTKQHVQAFSDYLNALWVMDGLMGNRRAIPSTSKTNSDYVHFSGLIYDRLAPNVKKQLVKKDDVLSLVKSRSFDVLIVLGAGDLDNQVPQMAEILRSKMENK